MSPDQIANIRALADGGVSGPDDVLALCNALAAAQAREARLVGELWKLAQVLDRPRAAECQLCGGVDEHDATCELTPARAAIGANGAALAAAIEGVLEGWFVGCDLANDEMDDLMAALRAAWRGA